MPTPTSAIKLTWLKLLALASIFLLSGSIGLAQTNNSADALVSYFIKFGNVKSVIRQQIETNAAFDPEEKKYLKSVVNRIDYKEMVAMLSRDVGAAFTSEELRECTQLVSTDALVKSAAIADQVADSEDAVDVLMAKLNKKEQDEVLAYHDTNCFLRTVIVIQSQENQEKMKTFGFRHICGALTQDRPAMLASNEFLRERCLNGN